MFFLFKSIFSGGYVHDLFTVSEVVSTVQRGLPSAECSWFPGLVIETSVDDRRDNLNHILLHP